MGGGTSRQSISAPSGLRSENHHTQNSVLFSAHDKRLPYHLDGHNVHRHAGRSRIGCFQYLLFTDGA